MKSVGELVLGGRVAEAVEFFDDGDLEHYHRTERLLPGAAGLAHVEHARFQFAAEQSEIDCRG